MPSAVSAGSLIFCFHRSWLNSIPLPRKPIAGVHNNAINLNLLMETHVGGTYTSEEEDDM